MFSTIKSLLFKNNNAIAEQIWLPFSVPINLIRLKVSNKSFLDKFYDDIYLASFFNAYQLSMIEYFFEVTNEINKGKIVLKFVSMFDPIFKDHNRIAEYNKKLTAHKTNKDALLGVDHASMAVAILCNTKKYLDNKIYLEAEKFYDSGDFLKRANEEKKILDSMSKGKDTSKMPKNFAVAQRFFELTFTKKLNEKFKNASKN